MKHPIPITLSETDQASLYTFIHAGKANARTFTRAHILLKAGEGWTDQQICAAFEVSRAKRRTGQMVPTVVGRRWCLLESLFTSAHTLARAQLGTLAQAALAAGR